MTHVRLALGCAAGLAVFGSAAFAAEGLTDPICPSAVPKITALEDAGHANDPKTIEKTARAVVDTYIACYNTQKFNARGGVLLQQEYMNYDQTRIGQYLIIVGRTLAAQGKAAEAAASFKDARARVQDVIEWAPPAQTIHGSSSGSATYDRNTDKNRSRWYDTAVAVRDAAGDELAKVQAGAPSPQPSAKP